MDAPSSRRNAAGWITKAPIQVPCSHQGTADQKPCPPSRSGKGVRETTPLPNAVAAYKQTTSTGARIHHERAPPGPTIRTAATSASAHIEAASTTGAG